ncbi:MAG: hypothetical protein ACK6DP_15380 [Gemmatimonas sp.]|jgi:hypothetical protein|uniref:hypothetical protein n=1 Tax=Gemmatimonas sp. TaxID=1962908 RepID=UPI00391F2148|nr:hypothetical protein [Gemmatimonadota bacterium]
MNEPHDSASAGRLGAGQTTALAAALGLVAYALIDAIPWLRSQGVPQGAVQFVWLLFVMGAAGLCGYLMPVRAWRWATIIMAVQPLYMLAVTLVRGEPDASPDTIPARTSLFIASVFITTASPFPLLAASAMASKRRSESR